MPQLRPDLNGFLVKSPASTGLYLVDRGQKRPIPSDATRDRVFIKKPKIIEDIDIDDIETGPALPRDAIIARGNKETGQYLIDHDVKRGIKSEETLKKYQFKGATQRTLTVVDQAIINSIPVGDTIV